MEIHQLRYFSAIVRAGSFTRAAEQLGITQPSLSQQNSKTRETDRQSTVRTGWAGQSA